MAKILSVSPLSFLLLVSLMTHFSRMVQCLPLQDPDVRNEMSQEILENMAAILNHEPSKDIRHNARLLHHPVFLGTDPSSVIPPELLQTILENDDTNFLEPNPLEAGQFPAGLVRRNDMVAGRKNFRFREGRPLLRKRTFDSISRNSGFGSSHSWGSGGRSGSSNLSFTFESLFPAIARGLRSVK